MASGGKGMGYESEGLPDAISGVLRPDGIKAGWEDAEGGQVIAEAGLLVRPPAATRCRARQGQPPAGTGGEPAGPAL